VKFRKDRNFSVREIGRGRDVEERRLEMTEVLREGGRWWRQEHWASVQGHLPAGCCWRSWCFQHLNYSV